LIYGPGSTSMRSGRCTYGIEGAAGFRRHAAESLFRAMTSS
jgi:hypothetical protein